MDPNAHWATDRGPPAPCGSGNQDPCYRCERCGLYNKEAEARIERLEAALEAVSDTRCCAGGSINGPEGIEVHVTEDDCIHCIARRALDGEDTDE